MCVWGGGGDKSFIALLPSFSSPERGSGSEGLFICLRGALTTLNWENEYFVEKLLHLPAKKEIYEELQRERKKKPLSYYTHLIRYAAGEIWT